MSESAHQQPRVVIVTPVYNDWPSFRILLDELDKCLMGLCSRITVVAVNDGSDLPPPETLDRTFQTIDTVQVVELAVNLGHQRAIAVGLAYAGRCETDCVVVMDSDGEDKPSDVARLVAHFHDEPNFIHVVQRGKRSESFGFRTCYLIYKIAFFIGTGTRITHGNFCLLPIRNLVGLLHSANTWNNLAASIARSRMPYRAHKMDRGNRYEGQSRMRFTALLLHGLSAVSVYLDVVTARLLIASGLLFASLIAVMIGILGIRFFTDLAIPGWTTIVAGMLIIVIIQLTMFASSVLFTLLHNRGQNLAVPAKMYELYAVGVRAIFECRTRTHRS